MDATCVCSNNLISELLIEIVGAITTALLVYIAGLFWINKYRKERRLELVATLFGHR